MSTSISLLCIFAGFIGFGFGVMVGVGAGVQRERARREWSETLSRSAREASCRRDHPAGGGS